MNTKINSRTGEQGFTLVELAIVMIIIGLLIGGILKGQELIANARVASAASKVKAIDAAINTFRDSYAGLPGDLPNPSTRLPNCATDTKCGMAVAGGGTLGNSQISGTTVSPGAVQDPASENIKAWAQLAATDMMGGIGNADSGAAIAGGTTVPNADVPGQFYIGYYNAAAALTATTGNLSPRVGHYLLLHNGLGAVASATTVSVPASAANRIDQKLDDGLPNTGSVLAMGATTATTGCATGNTATDTYSVAGTCGLYARIQQ